jgi:hypothetical protein
VARKIPISVASSDDLQLLTLEVKKIIDLSREQSLRKTSSSKLPELDISPPLRELLELNSGDAIPGISKLEELEEWLEEAKISAPQIHLTLPGAPGQKQKTEIIEWFRDQIHPLSMVFFEYNRSLAGGFAIRLGGQMFDYSFRHALLSNPDAMVRVMKSLKVEVEGV